MPARRRCAACGRLFELRPQHPDQSYCSAPACQRERRKLWQRERLATDPDYQANQARAQAEWIKRHPDYWREYRELHPEYTERNRDRQRRHARDEVGKGPADLAAVAAVRALESGLYALRIVDRLVLAKMDVSYLVELIPIRGETEPSPSLQREDSLGKRRRR